MRSLRFLAVLIVLTISSLTCSCAAVTVTDPHDPHFDRNAFRFEDYRSAREYVAAMLALLPVGTSKTEVDKLLVRHGGADIVDDGLNGLPGLRRTLHLTSRERAVHYHREQTPHGMYRCGYYALLIFDDHNVLTRPPTLNFGCDSP